MYIPVVFHVSVSSNSRHSRSTSCYLFLFLYMCADLGRATGRRIKKESAFSTCYGYRIPMPDLWGRQFRQRGLFAYWSHQAPFGENSHPAIISAIFAVTSSIIIPHSAQALASEHAQSNQDSDLCFLFVSMITGSSVHSDSRPIATASSQLRATSVPSQD